MEATVRINVYTHTHSDGNTEWCWSTHCATVVKCCYSYFR